MEMKLRTDSYGTNYTHNTAIITPKVEQRKPTQLNRNLYAYSIQMVKYCDYVGNNTVYPNVLQQLIKSTVAMSSHALEALQVMNEIEKESHKKMSQHSSSEVKYWLCLIRDTFDVEKDRCNAMLQEAIELADRIAIC